jgi:hypothetical protein
MPVLAEHPDKLLACTTLSAIVHCDRSKDDGAAALPIHNRDSTALLPVGGVPPYSITSTCAEPIH